MPVHASELLRGFVHAAAHQRRVICPSRHRFALVAGCALSSERASASSVALGVERVGVVVRGAHLLGDCGPKLLADVAEGCRGPFRVLYPPRLAGDLAAGLIIQEGGAWMPRLGQVKPRYRLAPGVA